MKFQVGRYSAFADNITGLLCVNHDIGGLSLGDVPAWKDMLLIIRWWAFLPMKMRFNI